jgi:hypothetical protein
MAIMIDQKSRYLRQASVCYEVAASMSGRKAGEMVRLANVYSDLADALNGSSAVAVREDHPDCPQCGLTMKPSQLLPATDLFPARETLFCEGCGEALTCRKA